VPNFWGRKGKITACRHYAFLASWQSSANPSTLAFRQHSVGDDKKESEVNLK